MKFLNKIKATYGLWTKSLSSDLESFLVGNNDGTTIGTSFQSLAKHGFKDNDVVYFIISQIARAASSVNLLDEGLPREVINTLKRPEQGKMYDRWMFEQMVYRLIGGASYSQIIRNGSTDTGHVRELPIIRPDRIQPILSQEPGLSDNVNHWQVSTGTLQKQLPPEEVFFSNLLDPLNDLEGWSPLEAARSNVSNRNKIAKHDGRILDNNGAPFGIVSMKSSADKMLPDLKQEQMEALSGKLNQSYERAIGKIWMFNRDFRFQRIGQTGQEMDFLKTDEFSARKTAMTFGFPAVLLGFAAGATFNNWAEAKEFLITDTVLPHLKLILADLALLFGVDEIKPDIDNIPALSGMRQRRMETLLSAYLGGLITQEEGRLGSGFPEKPKGTILVPTNSIPLDSL